MTKRFIEFLRRGWRRPPHVILRWLASKVFAKLRQPIDQWSARKLSTEKLLRLLGANDLNSLWLLLGKNAFPLLIKPILIDDYDTACPGDRARIISAAEDAVKHKINLLGSGPVELGPRIPWHKDFKSGHSWPNVASRHINVLDFSRNSDIKVPWELSRLQWLIPTGQAYLLSGEERYAQAVRELIKDWVTENPLGRGVNWTCAMEVALRCITLIWLFKAFHSSKAWRENKFRSIFLKLVYLHGNFVNRNLEWSDVNGNHLTTNAAGLVVVGLFFGNGNAPQYWSKRGWKILVDELPKQVFEDGVDFEASTAYHRLVTELFLLPALYRRCLGLEVEEKYSQSLCKMAEFIQAYSRSDGKCPLWGDADDGRTIPLGSQHTNDHRYLISIIGHVFGNDGLATTSSEAQAEVFWTLGPEIASKNNIASKVPSSKAFRDAGIFILRNQDDLVFVNCGPVGMAGRGGHGHNDCLSFEASLKGCPLITDCGAFVYSADPTWRNDFRSTSFHNTPIIDGKEQNRFVNPEYLWSLYDDAKPEVRHWSVSPEVDRFIGAHSGYSRLPFPVTPVRDISLDKSNHRIVIFDYFEGEGTHKLQIPYHFSLEAKPIQDGPGQWRITTEGQEFLILADMKNDWSANLEDGWVSPSYGIKHPNKVLNFYRNGPLKSLVISIMPADSLPEDPIKWLQAATVELGHFD